MNYLAKPGDAQGRVKKARKSGGGRSVDMTPAPFLNEQQLGALRQIDTCTVCNAIETFQVRLRNTGFADSSIRSFSPEFPPMVGFAATARLRSGDPPVGGGYYHDRTDWWQNILQVSPPRIVVLEDMDRKPGLGAFIGDVHGAILKALGCVGYVTNGAVRELPTIREMGLYLFAGDLAVSHAYAHIFDFGATINVGGMLVRPGDLLHGDRHGVLTIPKEIAAQIPAAASKLREAEDRIVSFCCSSDFSLEKLAAMLKAQSR
jgi:4-hydroxy-4-methyl-2-oxoglutarate aldolase